MDFSRLILSYEGREQDHLLPIPYVVQLERNGQLLWAVGFRHSTDPENPDFDVLQKLFENFVQRVEPSDSILFRETRDDTLRQTLREAKRQGEGSVLTYLGHQAKIVVVCPEPNPYNERKQLLKNFSKDEIQLLWLARDIVSWHRYKVAQSFEDFHKRMANRYLQESHWTDFDFSLQHAKASYEQLLESPFTTDFETAKRLGNPALEDTIVNAVARASSRFRDEHIVSEMAKYWGEGKNIFVVYGRTHVIMWEPALRAIVEA